MYFKTYGMMFSKRGPQRMDRHFHVEIKKPWGEYILHFHLILHFHKFQNFAAEPCIKRSLNMTKVLCGPRPGCRHPGQDTVGWSHRIATELLPSHSSGMADRHGN